MPELHHLALVADWEAAVAEGLYRTSTIGATLEQVGYIHMARPDQVRGVADRFYRGRTDVVLLDIDPLRLDAPLREDPVGETSFPHLYGPLPVAAVTAAVPLGLGDDGRLVLPVPGP